jgi:hypothetical protein
MRELLTLSLAGALFPFALAAGVAQPTFRPPAVPLVACDPYFSIWSGADRLTDAETTHWTRKPHPLHSMVRVDGTPYRLMGAEPAGVQPLPQEALEVLPTRTVYRFGNGQVEVTLTFITPALPYDIELLSRPVTYVTWQVRSRDGRNHQVAVYLDASSALAVDTPDQEVVWSREQYGETVALRVGTKDQPILRRRGDDRRIDWGYLYLTALPGRPVHYCVAPFAAAAGAFAAGRPLPVDDVRMPRPVSDGLPALAFEADLGSVGSRSVSQVAILAYDDEYSIQYFGHNLRPYWRRHGAEAKDLLLNSVQQYPAIARRCAAFDRKLMADLRRAGGDHYATICALAYRQCLAGNKIAADANGQPLLFPKENTSNGCIGTVDVIYPMSPLFLLFGSSLTKAMLVPNLEYASSPRWPWPFAPHDLGTYPKANGQVYGGGERTEENQMPVEESGNMLILLAALTQMEGNANFAARYWPVLERWAAYLKDKGFDPERQLSTDDFMGHLAHNTNLSLKAILGLASFSYLCDVRGLKAEAAEYRSLAKQFADRWAKEADDGDHFRLAFDVPGSWSQKYNLVWDKILNLGLFPDSVRATEMAFYRKVMNPYGVALDSRQGGVLAKTDWSMWTATLTGSRADFDALAEPVYRFLNDSPQRVAMGDAYNTKTGHHMFMNARPVVGGVFLKLLYDKPTWHKWAARDRTKARGWAPLPKLPTFVTVVPTSEAAPAAWRYTTQRPNGNWFASEFDASSWAEGPGGFGTPQTPGAVVGTVWNTSDIWLRREVTLSSANWHNLHLRIHHDEDAEVYINGVLVASESGFTTGYEEVPLLASANAALRQGPNLIAVHCHQTQGGQFIDVGLVDAEE